MSQLTTTRRSLLAAAPAVAVIAIVPALASGGQFERTVADFHVNADRRRERLISAI